VFDRQGLEEDDFDEAVAEADEADLLLAETTLLITTLLKLRLPNDKNNMAVLLKIGSEVHHLVTILTRA
jgi:hypothetical protein